MRDDGWLLKALNSNPSVSLDKLLKQTITALSPMIFEPSDTIYFSIANEAVEMTTSNFGYGENIPVFLPYKLRVNLGGTILFKASMYYTVPESASGGGSPNLQIYVNNVIAKKIYLSKYRTYVLEEIKIPVNKTIILLMSSENFLLTADILINGHVADGRHHLI